MSGWRGSPGTPGSLSHTFVFLTKEPEKLNVMVCVFSKKKAVTAFAKNRSTIHWWVIVCLFFEGCGGIKSLGKPLDGELRREGKT